MTLPSFLIPHGYKIWHSSSQGWVEINNLHGASVCWNGEEDVDVKVEAVGRGFKVKKFLQIDAVTSFGVDEYRFPLDGVAVQFHWMPPWLGERRPTAYRYQSCSKEKHAQMAPGN